MPIPTIKQLAQTPHVRTLAGMAGAPLDAGGVTPDQIAGLVAWYKADALGLANGAAVASWPDSSGNGHTLSQATGAKQPTFAAGTLNGLPTVAFASAASQLMATNAFTFTLPATIFVVGKVLSLGAHQTFVDSTSGANTRMLNCFSAAIPLRLVNSTEIDWLAPLPMTGYTAFYGVLNGSASVLGQNGREITGAVGAANSTGITLGADGAGATPLNGNIAEAMFYAGALNYDDRHAIIAYLGQKYSLPTF